MRRAGLGLLSAVAVSLPLLAGACGDDASSVETLPPILTTTIVPTTIFATTTTVRRYYVIQPGDTLSKIADRFSVEIVDLMALNGITDPDHIEAGEEIEIPPAKLVIDSLPPVSSSSSTSSTTSG